MAALKRPIAIYHEHPHWFERLFAELDRRKPGELELVQFGLMAEFIGQGLGKYFLQWTIDRAWGYQPTRLWLHTCTLDHPAALPNYLKAGFAVTAFNASAYESPLETAIPAASRSESPAL